MRSQQIAALLDDLRPPTGAGSRQEWVVQELRRLVRRRLQPGDRLPPVRALQKALDVSGPTVRAAQGLMAQEGLIEQRHGSGVYVTERAAALRIGIVSELNLLHATTGVYFRGAADAARRALAEEGAESSLYIGHYASGECGPAPTCPAFWADAAAGRLDGAILLNLPNGNEWPARVKHCPIPVVGTYTDATIDLHPEAMMIDALRTLQAAGARRCAVIGWGVDSGADAFARVAGSMGIEVRAGWTKIDLDPAYPGSGWSAFRELWAAESTKPDGLVVLDDVLFADAQLAILELGIRVPEQLRIVTQTNRGAATPFSVPAMAFELDPADSGAALVQLLLDRIAGDTEPRTRIVPYTRLEKHPRSPSSTPAATPIPRRQGAPLSTAPRDTA